VLSGDPVLALTEIQQCVELQRSVNWHSEIVPAHVFRADSIGLVEPSIDLGYVLVAKLVQDCGRESVIGFARVTSSMEPTRHWLHEIVVSNEYQSMGVGLALMRAIRTRSLESGAKELYFTCDPLVGSNCRLYLTKCGAVGVKVFDNLYGLGAGTDPYKSHRLLLCWNLLGDMLPRSAVVNPETIPVVDTVSFHDTWMRIMVSIPYRLEDLTPEEKASWQNRTFPILAVAVNKKAFRVTNLLTMPTECRNYLLLEK
jgi:predicted GNAT superfamily acetyltransferase